MMHAGDAGTEKKKKSREIQLGIFGQSQLVLLKQALVLVFACHIHNNLCAQRYGLLSEAEIR